MRNVHNSQAALSPKWKQIFHNLEQIHRENDCPSIQWHLLIKRQFNLAHSYSQTVTAAPAAARKTTIVKSVKALPLRWAHPIETILKHSIFNSIRGDFSYLFFSFGFIIVCDSIDNNNRFNQSRKVIDIWRKKKGAWEDLGIRHE